MISSWELWAPIPQQKGTPSEPPKMRWFVKKDVVRYTILLGLIARLFLGINFVNTEMIVMLTFLMCHGQSIEGLKIVFADAET